MAIKPICERCGHELTEFGGILLSPPTDKNQVEKLHLCVWCYGEVVKEMQTYRKANP